MASENNSIFRNQLEQLLKKSKVDVCSDYDDFLASGYLHDFSDSEEYWVYAVSNPDEPKRLANFIKKLLLLDKQ